MTHSSYYRRWSVSEHNTLVAAYRTATVSEIALLIDRPVPNIKRYLYRIGLRKPGRKRRPRKPRTRISKHPPICI